MAEQPRWRQRSGAAERAEEARHAQAEELAERVKACVLHRSSLHLLKHSCL